MYYTNPTYYDFWTRKMPPETLISLPQMLQIDLLAYTSLFFMFAGLAIFLLLTWKTCEFDLNFAYEKFYLF